MTITTTQSSIQYEGDDSATTFSYTFLIPDQDYLIVTITDENGNETVLSTSEYSVTGIDDPSGGIVTYPLSGSPLSVSNFITIERELPLEQLTELDNQSGYYPQVVEDAFDYQMMVSQQIDGLINRALVAPLSDPVGNLTIPNATSRASMLLGFDSDGNPIAAAITDADVVIVSAAMIPVVEAVTIADARDQLGIGDAGTLDIGSGLRNDGSGNLQVYNDTDSVAISAAIVAADNQKQKICSAALTFTLPLSSTLFDGFAFYTYAVGGDVTLTPNAADAIGNQAVGAGLTIHKGTFARVTTNGAGTWYVAQHLVAAAIASGLAIINGTVTCGVATNAATFTLKTLASADPSSMDPVYVMFRNATAQTSTPVIRVVSSALSVTIPNTATMGFSNSTAGRIWTALLDNAGAVELAVVNCRDGINLYPLQGWGIVSTTLLDTSSDSAAVMYSAAARSSVAYVAASYHTWETGLTAAGVWDTAATRGQQIGYGVPLPGTVIQTQQNITPAVATGTTTMQSNNAIPQNTEGDQYLSQSITPTSKANLLEIEAQSILSSNNNGQNMASAMFQDSTANAISAIIVYMNNAAGCGILHMLHLMLSSTVSATTFKIRSGSQTAGTTTFNGANATRVYGGVANSYLRVKEIMA